MSTKFYICMSLVAFGIVAQFLGVLYKLERAGTILSPITYARQHPYQVAMTIVSAYAVAALLWFTDQLNYAAALMMGIIGTEVLEHMRASAVQKLRDDPETETGV